MADLASPNNNLILPEQPTVIVVHQKERRSKCSVEPLRGRDGFLFRKFPEAHIAPLPNYVRLGIGGPQLSPADRSSGLLVLDATWRLAEKMEEAYQDVPIRSIPDCETAYPRNSKLFTDPSAGLATIEAIYVAYRILGYSVEDLLSEYRWGEQFVERNGERIEEYMKSLEAK